MFQRFVNDVVMVFFFFTISYVDVVMVALQAKSEHEIHFRFVLERFQKNGIAIIINKYGFGV